MARYVNSASVLALVALMLAVGLGDKIPATSLEGKASNTSLGGHVPNTSLEGSVEAKAGEFPSMVAIEVLIHEPAEWIVLCSGTVLDERHILAPAYCFDRKDKHKIKIGCVDLSKCSKKQENGISRVWIHPDRIYGSSQVAIARLSAKLNFFKSPVKPVMIADFNIYDHGHSNDVLSVAGWGRSFYRGNIYEGQEAQLRSSRTLRKIEADLVSVSDCVSSFEPFWTDLSIVCIAGRKNRDVSKTDLGGPLFQVHKGKSFQVGLFIYPNWNPSILLDVTKFRNWIQACIRDEKNCKGTRVDFPQS